MYYRIRRDVLQTFFGAIDKLTHECIIVVSEEGIDSLQVDTANVAMINCALTPEGYDVIKEMGDPDDVNFHGTYGVDVLKLLEVVKNMAVEIELRISDGFMNLSAEGDTFNLRLLDPTSVKKPKGIPNIDFKSSVKITGKDFMTALKSAGLVGDKIRFENDPDIGKFRASTQGNENTYRKDFESAQEITGEYANALFSLDYLVEISKIISAADSVVVKLKTDNPIWIEYSFNLMGIDSIYMLAPRMENG